MNPVEEIQNRSIELNPPFLKGQIPLWLGALIIGVTTAVAGIFLGVVALTNFDQIVPVFVQPKNEYAGWKTYRNEEHRFEFKYSSTWNEIIELEAAQNDYLPAGRTFVAIYSGDKRQDFDARIDVYSDSLQNVIKENRFIRDLSDVENEVINGLLWTRIGSEDYLIERIGLTFHVTGEATFLSPILATFRFLDLSIASPVKKNETDTLSAPTSSNRIQNSYDITLEVDASFSIATLNIYHDGRVFYRAKQDGESESTASKTLAITDIVSLAKLVDEVNFFKMQSPVLDKSAPFRSGGSSYRITVRTLPSTNTESVKYEDSHKVGCYEFNCEQSFERLKKKISELWGREILEAGE